METTQANAAVPAEADMIAAMFETHAEAAAASGTLASAGVDPGALHCVTPGAESSSDTWATVRNHAVPETHAHVYAEGIDRGHALLFVRVPATQQAQVVHLLEGLEPIDVMSRTASWREQGWSGVHRSQPQPATPPRMLFEDAAYQDHQRSTGLINENDHAWRLGALTNPMGLSVPEHGTSRVQRFVSDPTRADRAPYELAIGRPEGT